MEVNHHEVVAHISYNAVLAVDLPNGDMVDVDIMIGELDALGKGVGPKSLRCLFDRLKSQGVPLTGLAGAVANGRAMSACKKAGLAPFRDFFESGETYRHEYVT